VPCISLSQNQNPKQRGERPPILPFPSPAAISPRWPRPPSRQSRRRRPPRRRAWPRATPSLLPQPRAAPRSRSAPPRAGPFSRSAPPRSRLTPSAARTAAPSHPGRGDARKNSARRPRWLRRPGASARRRAVASRASPRVGGAGRGSRGSRRARSRTRRDYRFAAG